MQKKVKGPLGGSTNFRSGGVMAFAAARALLAVLANASPHLGLGFLLHALELL
jgi:hypothetical protein